MSRGLPPSTRYRSLQASRLALARTAPLVRFGLFTAGLGVFMDQARPLLSDAQFTWGERRVLGAVAVVTLGGFGLAAWVAGRLMRTASELIEVFEDGAEAAVRSTFLIETQLVPGIVRAAAALERLAEGPSPDPPDRAAEAVRRTVRDGRWGRAEQLLRSFRTDNPHSPDVAALEAELSRARRAEADDLRARLDAARAADDPDRVIACRDALTQHLRGEPLKDLDRQVVRWLADRIKARAQSGAVTPDLAALAGRVADSFADTDEGAALEASLPNLRRRAGLCGVCSRPYRGSAAACPDCRAGHSGAPARPGPGGAIPGGTP